MPPAKNSISKNKTQRVRGNLLDENDTHYVCLNTISGKFNSINTSKSEKISRVIKLRFC